MKNNQDNNYYLTGKKSFLIFILSIFMLFSAFNPVLAQEDEDTDSPSPNISEDEVKEKIKERLEQVVGDKLEQVKGAIKKRAEEKLYALAGTVNKIEDNLLTLNTALGEQAVKVASQAAILRIENKQSSDIEITDIEEDEFIIAMGTREEGLLVGKRIIVSSDKPVPAEKRKLLFGKVTEVDDDKISFSSNGESELQTIEIGKKTKLIISGISKPEIEDIQVNDLLRAIVALDEDEQIDEVRTILIIPGATNPAAAENEVEATPSAVPEED